MALLFDMEPGVQVNLKTFFKQPSSQKWKNLHSSLSDVHLEFAIAESDGDRLGHC